MSKDKPKVKILSTDIIGDTVSLKVRLNYPSESVEKTFNWPRTESKEEIQRQLRMIWEQFKPSNPVVNPDDITDVDWEEK